MNGQYRVQKNQDIDNKVQDVKKLMGIKTDSKAIHRLIEWGHVWGFGKK